SGVTPARGSNKLSLKGNLVLTCGIEEKTTDAKEVAMKAKTKEDIGDFKLQVTQEKGFGTQGASFSIMASKPNIKSVTVKDADGKEVKVLSFGNFGFGKMWTFNFALEKVVEKAKVSVTYFSKEEKVTVPVELSFGLGL